MQKRERQSPLQFSLFVRRLNQPAESPDKRVFSQQPENNYSAFIFTRGEGQLVVDFKAMDVQKHMIVFVQPGQPVYMEAQSTLAGWIISCSPKFLTSRAVLPEYWADLHLLLPIGQVRSIQSTHEGFRSYLGLLEEMSRWQSTTSYRKKPALGVLFELFLLRSLADCDGEEVEEEHLELLQLFKEAIGEHDKKWHRVTEFADHLYVDPYHLSYICKRLVRYPAKKMILESLMIKACRQLIFSKKPVRAIAGELGFSAPHHFSHILLTYRGMSPTAFRSKYRAYFFDM